MFLPSFKRARNESGTPFRPLFFLEMARPSFELAFDEEIIEAPPKKIFQFASVDEASMDKLDMNCKERSSAASQLCWSIFLGLHNQFFVQLLMSIERN